MSGGISPSLTLREDLAQFGRARRHDGPENGRTQRVVDQWIGSERLRAIKLTPGRTGRLRVFRADLERFIASLLTEGERRERGDTGG